MLFVSTTGRSPKRFSFGGGSVRFFLLYDLVLLNTSELRVWPPARVGALRPSQFVPPHAMKETDPFRRSVVTCFETSPTPYKSPSGRAGPSVRSCLSTALCTVPSCESVNFRWIPSRRCLEGCLGECDPLRVRPTEVSDGVSLKIDVSDGLCPWWVSQVRRGPGTLLGRCLVHSLVSGTSDGFRVRLRRLSEYGSVAYLIERPTRETQAEQYSDTILECLQQRPAEIEVSGGM